MRAGAFNVPSVQRATIIGSTVGIVAAEARALVSIILVSLLGLVLLLSIGAESLRGS